MPKRPAGIGTCCGACAAMPGALGFAGTWSQDASRTGAAYKREETGAARPNGYALLVALRLQHLALICKLDM